MFDEVKNDIELNIDSWKEFKLSDLFDIYKCKQKNKEVKKVPLITATSFNNGVKEYIETDIYEKGNKITVTCNGACGDAFYQKNDFQSNGDVGVLSPKFDMTDDIALFICKIIEAEKFKYSYGRKYNLEKLNSTVIKLPELNGRPNYEWMEKFIKNLPYSCCLEGKS